MSHIVISTDVILHNTHEQIKSRGISVNGGLFVSVNPSDSEEESDELLNILKIVFSLLDKNPNNLNINVSTHWHNCECCGSYVDDYWNITVNDEPVIEFVADGHFGGADDLHDITTLVVKTLQAMGHEVSVVRSGKAIFDISFSLNEYTVDYLIEIIAHNSDLVSELAFYNESDYGYSNYEDSLVKLLKNIPVLKITVSTLNLSELTHAFNSLTESGLQMKVDEFKKQLVVDSGG